MRIRAGGRTFHVKDCRGVSCVRGLMFDKMERVDGALVRGWSMWMPFVKFELNLFFLDDKMKIIEIKKAMPMTLSPRTWKTHSCSGAKYCLEMKKGMCKAKVTDKVSIL